MKYHVQFQHQDEDGHIDDVGQDDEIEGDGEPVLIPAPGDSVQLKWGGKSMAFKVRSRHFSYIMGNCLVNIVMTDITPEDLRSRVRG